MVTRLRLFCRPLSLFNVPVGSAHCVVFCSVIIAIRRWLPAGCAGVSVVNIVAVGSAVVVVGITFDDMRLLLSLLLGIKLILIICTEISSALGVTLTTAPIVAACRCLRHVLLLPLHLILLLVLGEWRNLLLMKHLWWWRRWHWWHWLPHAGLLECRLVLHLRQIHLIQLLLHGHKLLLEVLVFDGYLL